MRPYGNKDVCVCVFAHRSRHECIASEEIDGMSRVCTAKYVTCAQG